MSVLHSIETAYTATTSLLSLFLSHSLTLSVSHTQIHTHTHTHTHTQTHPLEFEERTDQHSAQISLANKAPHEESE